MSQSFKPFIIWQAHLRSLQNDRRMKIALGIGLLFNIAIGLWSSSQLLMTYTAVANARARSDHHWIMVTLLVYMVGYELLYHVGNAKHSG